jgi:hypothetical protein
LINISFLFRDRPKNSEINSGKQRDNSGETANYQSAQRVPKACLTGILYPEHQFHNFAILSRTKEEYR